MKISFWGYLAFGLYFATTAELLGYKIVEGRYWMFLVASALFFNLYAVLVRQE